MTPAHNLATLSKCLEHVFKNATLLSEALTHSSVLGGEDVSRRNRQIKPPANLMNYERLEFLGDRVLGLVVADMLFQKFPGDNEGALARRHTALVRREALALVAHHINLGSYLRLSRGEEDAGGRSNPSLLADCCEAVIGALYLDGGLEAAARFIHRRWQVLLSGEHAPPKDAKSALQEWVQARGMSLPSYTTIATKGTPHEPLFSIEVRVEGQDPIVADGPSKRVAEQAAAEILLKKMQG